MVTLGLSMTLFPLPVREMKEVIAEWGGKLFFDGAHQIGLIGGGQFQDPLREGADILTGSAGKTFSGPQSGIILWDDPALTEPVTTAVFPVWAATHQVNRVAALALATAEALAFGPAYMAQIVRNAQALARALEERGIPMLGAHKGFTRTHQAIADVGRFGRGLAAAQKLERANIIVNKNLLPYDKPGGLGLSQRASHRHHRGDAAGHEGTGDGRSSPISSPRSSSRARRPNRCCPGCSTSARGIRRSYYCFENGLPA